MNASAVTRAHLETAIALARLFERVERGPLKVSPAQYQGLVRQLKTALEEKLPSGALQALLGAHPSAAELYENMHYEHAGLARSPLDRAVAAEIQAAQALAKFTLGGRKG